jgi:hypothetical protein
LYLQQNCHPDRRVAEGPAVAFLQFSRRLFCGEEILRGKSGKPVLFYDEQLTIAEELPSCKRENALLAIVVSVSWLRRHGMNGSVLGRAEPCDARRP